MRVKKKVKSKKQDENVKDDLESMYQKMLVEELKISQADTKKEYFWKRRHDMLFILFLISIVVNILLIFVLYKTLSA